MRDTCACAVNGITRAGVSCVDALFLELKIKEWILLDILGEIYPLKVKGWFEIWLEGSWLILLLLYVSSCMDTGGVNGGAEGEVLMGDVVFAAVALLTLTSVFSKCELDLLGFNFKVCLKWSNWRLMEGAFSSIRMDSLINSRCLSLALEIIAVLSLINCLFGLWLWLAMQCSLMDPAYECLTRRFASVHWV